MRQDPAAPTNSMTDERATISGSAISRLGGPTPPIPVLRRPDLRRVFSLASPSMLFYLFSALHRPTSQAPRVDEARHDQLYELEIALAKTPRAGEPAPLWLVDRLYRNLLVDVTAYASREICIDKLYSPDGPTGGWLVDSAFEIRRCADSLASNCCCGRSSLGFARAAARRSGALGHALHDRFMLPHFVWKIFWVSSRPRASGLSVRSAWYQAQLIPVSPLWRCRAGRRQARSAASA